jgi:hypothetical protein
MLPMRPRPHHEQHIAHMQHRGWRRRLHLAFTSMSDAGHDDACLMNAWHRHEHHAFEIRILDTEIHALQRFDPGALLCSESLRFIGDVHFEKHPHEHQRHDDAHDCERIRRRIGQRRERGCGGLGTRTLQRLLGGAESGSVRRGTGK